MAKKASNNAGKHINRIVDTHSTVGGSVMTFVFRDNSYADLTMNIFDPQLEVRGPRRSFATLFKNDAADITVTTENVGFAFRDGSRLDINISNIPKKVN